MSPLSKEELSTEHIQPGQYPYCPHGARLGSCPDWSGGWNGGVSRCGCCFSTFGYIDSGSLSVNGESHGRSWQPKDRCGSCGGKYVEY